MKSLIPEVHLFICMDSRVSPGPILQSLDFLRAQDWQSEIVLICDKSWEPYITIDQPTLYLDKKMFFHNSSVSKDEIVNINALEDFLAQLDDFNIKNITQIGELSWGRWLQTYFSEVSSANHKTLHFEEDEFLSIEILNFLSNELSFSLDNFQKESPRNSLIYVDPYENGVLSPYFLSLIKDSQNYWPEWINIIAKEEDIVLLSQYGLGENLVDSEEGNINLFNQHVLCFDNQSPYFQCSRSYKVALLDTQLSNKKALFVPGDITIRCEESIHITEITNILSYWKRGRLKELAFQWLNMGIEVNMVEIFHQKLSIRNVQSYAIDLLNCQKMINKFSKDSFYTDKEFGDYLKQLKKETESDSYTLSFSIKLLLMIVERMVASAKCGERVFQRLGSDYHRLIIGECLIEGLVKGSGLPFEKVDILQKLSSFQNFLYKIDYFNDLGESELYFKES